MTEGRGLSLIITPDIEDIPAALRAVADAMESGQVVLDGSGGSYALVLNEHVQADEGEDPEAFELRLRRIVSDTPGASFSMLVPGLN